MTAAFLRNRRCLAGLALLLALAPNPARAMIVKDDQVQSAHDAGKRHKAVVGILHSAMARGTENHCTGVYVGPSADGRHGYVLTAAHVFFDAQSDLEPRELQDVALYFGPEIDDVGTGDTFKVKATRLFIHPDRVPEDGKTVTLVRNDLALLEFELLTTGKVLESRGIAPATLYAGVGHTTPMMTGEIAGFGWFASHASADYVRTPIWIHGGKTHVTYGQWLGRTGFLSWLPMTEQGFAERGAVGQIPYRFVADSDGTIQYGAMGTQTLFTVRTHREQAMFGPGDSGGPLFLRNSAGALELAGIASASTGAMLIDREVPPPFNNAFPHYLQIWEPVQDSLAWIRSVLEAKAPEAEAKGETKGQLEGPKGVYPAFNRRPFADEDSREPVWVVKRKARR